jgi:outer membrane protein
MIHEMTSIAAMAAAVGAQGFVVQTKGTVAPLTAGWCGVMALMLLLGVSPAGAEEPPAVGVPGSATLEQAAQAALKHYQPFHIVQETLYQLQRQRREALAVILPTLSVNAVLTQRPGSEGGSSGFLIHPHSDKTLDLMLEQPLFTGGKAVGGLREATALMRAGEQGVEQSREELLLDVADAFYGVLKAHKQVELFEAERTRLEEHRRSAEARVKVGDATRTVLLRAEAELAGAEAALVRARSDEWTAREQLALLTDLPLDAALATPAAQEPPAVSDSLMANAQARRPEWLRSRFQEQAAEQQVRVARASFFPSLSLQLAYKLEGQVPQTLFLVRSDKYALLQLQFPLFEGGLRFAKVQEASSQLRAAALNTQFLQASINAEVRNALRDVKTLAGVVEQFTAQVAFAKENYELTSRQFAVGLATNLDVLDANSTLLSAEQQLAAATFDHDVAVLRFYKSLGRLTDHLLGQE